jgi:uncharacterized membrane protein (DUF485 family)
VQETAWPAIRRASPIVHTSPSHPLFPRRNTMSPKTAHQILDDPEFIKLVRQKNTVTTVLTIVELVLYFGFIALIAYNKPFLGQKVSEGSAITIGIPIAVGVIFLSWILTGIYVFWANNKYDVMVKSVKDRLGR